MLCVPSTYILSNMSATQNYLLTLHRLQKFYLKHYKVSGITIRNQHGNAENQGGDLSIVVEMTQKRYGNDEFKEWKEVKIIINEHIYKNLISDI